MQFTVWKNIYMTIEQARIFAINFVTCKQGLLEDGIEYKNFFFLQVKLLSSNTELCYTRQGMLPGEWKLCTVSAALNVSNDRGNNYAVYKRFGTHGKSAYENLLILLSLLFSFVDSAWMCFKKYLWTRFKIVHCTLPCTTRLEDSTSKLYMSRMWRCCL